MLSTPRQLSPPCQEMAFIGAPPPPRAHCRPSTTTTTTTTATDSTSITTNSRGIRLSNEETIRIETTCGYGNTHKTSAEARIKHRSVRNAKSHVGGPPTGAAIFSFEHDGQIVSIRGSHVSDTSNNVANYNDP